VRESRDLLATTSLNFASGSSENVKLVRTIAPVLVRNPENDHCKSCYILPSRSAVVSLRAETTKVEPDIVVLHLSGIMTLGEIEELESLVRDLLDRGEKKLIFDLCGIRRIDSVGGMTMVRCFFAAKEAGGELRFASAGANVIRLFKNTHLDTLLPFDPTVAAACEQLTVGPKADEHTA
jgi:anti-anti-sigma factor